MRSVSAVWVLKCRPRVVPVWSSGDALEPRQPDPLPKLVAACTSAQCIVVDGVVVPRKEPDDVARRRARGGEHDSHVSHTNQFEHFGILPTASPRCFSRFSPAAAMNAPSFAILTSFHPRTGKCEHTFVTSRGAPYMRFRRALDRGNGTRRSQPVRSSTSSASRRLSS